jgi:uncharacterized protein YndB with AHSA1/START domain
MAIHEIPSASSLLHVSLDVAGCRPERLFAYWTQPDLLVQWWPQAAEIDPRVNGAYHLSWPTMDWHLRGRYLLFAPGTLLAFTWKWDSDAQEPGERIVYLTFQPLGASDTRLLLLHGMYAATPEEQRARVEDHLAGWRHFLPKLQAAVAT